MIYKNTVWIIYNPNMFLVIFLLLDRLLLYSGMIFIQYYAVV